MTYISATQSASATPAKDFQETTVHNALTANGFTYVEAVVSGGTARVYLSPSASNGIIDWYLITYRASDAATQVAFSVCELYNSTTHLMRAYIPTSGASVPNAADLYRYNDATGVGPASSSYSRFSLNISAATFSYWMSVNAGRLVISTRIGSTDQGYYLGLCDNLLPTATLPSASVQLVATPLTDNTGTAGPSSGGCTREPGQTASTAQNWTANVRLSAGLGFGFHTGTADVYTSRLYASQAAFFSARAASSSPRGLLRGVVAFLPTGAVAGDTATLTDLSGSTKTYTCFATVSGVSSWVDQAA